VSWTYIEKTKFAHELLSVLNGHPARSAEQIQAWRSRIEDAYLVYDCRLPRREREALIAGTLHITKGMCRNASAKGESLDWNKALAVLTASSLGEYIDRPHILEEDGAET